tara:strand:- start:1557 stop:1961 length:405 start_codon:yes stop_codon:yes gene_type:complete
MEQQICLWCREDTSFGTGKFVNRIPASRQDSIDDEYETGYQCADCQAEECSVCKQSVIDYSFTENCDVVCDECMNDKMVFLHQEDMVKKYGHLFKINAEDFDYGGEQWEKFLDDLRGITFVDSQEDGYLVQEIE